MNFQVNNLNPFLERYQVSITLTKPEVKKKMEKVLPIALVINTKT